MKSKFAVQCLAAAVLGLAVVANAIAQTRHDEKPHGPPKKAVKKSDIKQPMGGTRHDEKPHGAPAKTGDAEKKAEAKK